MEEPEQNPAHEVAAPIIRWAGSKRKLVEHLVRAAPPRFETYFEPFFGSGCLYFALRPERAMLNDLNRDLIAFYRTLRDEPRAVIRGIAQLKPTASEFYRVRAQLPKLRNPISRAAAFLFLNRLCFNGIYRTNRRGEFNVPMGVKTGDFPSKASLLAAVYQLKKARLSAVDFEKSLSKARRNDFVYLDPPYVYKARRHRGEYGPRSFSPVDIPRLRRLLVSLDRKGTKFLLSYIACDELSNLLRGFKYELIPVSRCVAGAAAKRKVVSEVLIRNY